MFGDARLVGGGLSRWVARGHNTRLRGAGGERAVLGAKKAWGNKPQEHFGKQS